MTSISLIGILIALAAMMFFSYKGAPVIVTAPLCGIFVCLTSGIPFVEGMASVYMAGASGFFQRFLWTMFTGAIFGTIMSDSGAARSLGLKFARLARKFKGNEKLAAIWCIVALAFLLSYGGISVFVCFFTVIAVSKELYQELDIPWRLYACSCLGPGVMALTMAPGTPSVNNSAIPVAILGTTPMAAPVLGIIACVLAIIIGQLYFTWELRNVKKNDEHFLPTGKGIADVQFHDPDALFEEMNIILCVIPSIVLFVVLNFLHQPVYIASAAAIVVAIALYWKRLTTKTETLRRGALQAINSISTVSIVVGFGSVVAATIGYGVIVQALTNLPGPGYLQVIVAVNIAAGVTSSSSGGLTIALNSLADRFINQMQLNPEVVHRLAAISSGGLDSLPCNGVILNELNQARLTPKVGYRPMLILSVITPNIIVVILAVLTTVFGIV